jgi:hypothetical protein
MLLSNYKLNKIVQILYGRNYQLIQKETNYQIKNKKYNIYFDLLSDNKLNKEVRKEITTYIIGSKTILFEGMLKEAIDENNYANLAEYADKELLNLILEIEKFLDKKEKENKDLINKLATLLFPNNKKELKTNYICIRTSKSEIHFNPLKNMQQLFDYIINRLINISYDISYDKSTKLYTCTIKNDKITSISMEKILCLLFLKVQGK